MNVSKAPGFSYKMRIVTSRVLTAAPARILSVFVLLVLHYGHAWAQQTEVHLRLFSLKKEAIPFATFKVAPANDSTQMYQKVSDSTGSVVFPLKTGSTYQVSVTAVGFAPVEKRIIITPGSASFNFTTHPVAQSLNTIVVTANRPVMRQEEDKTVVDPTNLAASSTNAYEILEKTPGLFVDQDGNVYLNSNTPATIYINGREMKMSTADIATMLKSLPPGSIEKIEILRTPSAKYDASGSGGIVNVV